ncbi:hypothetical protein ARNL5_03716 [Anaerolineae bacterium]|nr:hypothetical protein ARNL5_03716 [Anaerolineae bacterium]
MTRFTALLVFLALPSCSNDAEPHVSAEMLLADPAAFEGRTVHLDGPFRHDVYCNGAACTSTPCNNCRGAIGIGETFETRIALVPGEGWVDIGRSRALWNDVFEGPQALVRKGGWPDRASVGIPALYVNTGLILSEAMQSVGDNAGATKVLQGTEQVARATRIDEFFSFINQQGGTPLPGLTGDSAPRLPVPAPPPVKKESGGN